MVERDGVCLDNIDVDVGVLYTTERFSPVRVLHLPVTNFRESDERGGRPGRGGGLGADRDRTYGMGSS